MASYAFTRSAKEDLLDIWLYTSEVWGAAQADRYQDDLQGCCERIAAGVAHVRPVPSIDGVKSHHCRHHYVFFVERTQTVVVIAVIHERMDLIERLRPVHTNGPSLPLRLRASASTIPQ